MRRWGNSRVLQGAGSLGRDRGWKSCCLGVALGGLAFCLCLGTAGAEDREVAASPNRPTVADPADLTPPGYLEVELGWTGSFRSAQYRSQHSVPFLAKLALNEQIQLRLEGSAFLQVRANDGDRASGIGDWSPGLQWKFLDQGDAVPSMALGVALKLPTASSGKGLGTGKLDHRLTLLMSKDIEPVHIDLNVAHGWLGRERGGGYDRLWIGALAASVPLGGKWELEGEIYGFSSPNAGTPRIVSTLWSFSYAYRPTMVFDFGVDVGLNKAAPEYAIFMGMTMTLAKLF